MNKNQLIILVLLFLLQVSCNRNNSLQEVSQKLCNCFANYSEEDSESMINTVQLIDSLGVKVSDFPKEKLINQLEKDCPLKANLIEILAD